MIGESSLSNKDVGVGIYIDSKSICWPSLVVSYVTNLHTASASLPCYTAYTRSGNDSLKYLLADSSLFHTLHLYSKS